MTLLTIRLTSLPQLRPLTRLFPVKPVRFTCLVAKRLIKLRDSNPNQDWFTQQISHSLCGCHGEIMAHYGCYHGDSSIAMTLPWQPSMNSG